MKAFIKISRKKDVFTYEIFKNEIFSSLKIILHFQVIKNMNINEVFKNEFGSSEFPL